MNRSAKGRSAEGGHSKAVEADVAELLAQYSPEVRDLAMKVRALVRSAIPDALEEVHPPTKMIGFTYLPGTYKGLILTVSPQKTYVNVIFSKGVELMELDPTGLLEGTGKLARHIKFRGPERLDDPNVRTILEEAAVRTPR
jgi:hypothetical protein